MDSIMNKHMIRTLTPKKSLANISMAENELVQLVINVASFLAGLGSGLLVHIVVVSRCISDGDEEVNLS